MKSAKIGTVLFGIDPDSYNNQPKLLSMLLKNTQMLHSHVMFAQEYYAKDYINFQGYSK